MQSRPDRPNRLVWLPWLALLASLLVTYLVWDDTREDSRQARQARFDFFVEEVLMDIDFRMRAYEEALRGVAGLFSASREVARDEFKAYLDTLQLSEYYPGIQALGFAFRLSPAELPRHEARVRAEGFPDYTVKPVGEREHYGAITYLEPLDARNLRAFGYDMYSDPVRRDAMRRAWETGALTTSGKVRLLQENGVDEQAGLLMYVPVYRDRMAATTAAGRREQLVGWAYAAFRVGDLMRGVLRQHHTDKHAMLDLEIYDGDTITPASLLYDSIDGQHSPNGEFEARRLVAVGGHSWTVQVRSRAGFEPPQKLFVIAFVGAVGSVMVFWVLWLLIHGRNRAMQLATAMTRELGESERYQRELLASLPAAVIVHAPDTSIQYCNEEACRLFGMDAASMKALAANAAQWRFLQEDGTPMPVARYPVNQVLASGEPLYDFIGGIQRNDDMAPTWVQVSAFPYADAGGHVSRVVVCCIDITARRNTKLSLLHALADLDDLYNHAPCGYHSLDAEGRFIRVNRTELDWLGYLPEDLLGRRFVELLSPEGLATFRENFPRFKSAGRINDLEFDLQRKDGTYLPVLISATALYDDAGHFVSSRSTVYDITDRREAERRLRRLNGFYRVLSHANRAIVHIRDAHDLLAEICRIAVEEGGFVMAWAGRVEDGQVVPYATFGHEEGYLAEVRIIVADRKLGTGPTGMAIREGRHFICDDIANDARMEPWRAAALRRGYHASAAFPVRVGDAVIGAINFYAPATNYFSGDVVEMLDDLTEDVSFAMNAHSEAERRQRAEQELRELNEQLEQRVQQRTRELEIANKELEAFSYSVSHDLRAPLRGIDGFSQVLLQRYQDKLDDTGRDYLNRVRRASQRMGELIDDLLQLSRLTRGTLRREEVNLSALAESLLQELQRGAPERAVQVTIQPDLRTFGDPGLLRAVLDNLLGNAWKFTRHAAQPTIEFGGERRGDELVYFVRDNGAGFDNAYAHKLFQVFQRLHGSDEFEGTGIGLATVSRIVQRHLGRVWAEGAPGQGATFYFTLPQRMAERDGEAPPTQSDEDKTHD